MSAIVIDGKAIAQDIRAEVRREARRLKSERNIVPGLAFILVGENPASQAYVRMKGKACDELGFHSVTERLPSSATERQVLELIDRFNADPKIHGILTQLPLPAQIDEQRVLLAIDDKKDVDGFHPINVGRLLIGVPCFRPATPYGVQELLMRTGNDPAGKHVVIVGRSNIVGKPLAGILLQKKKGANAIVTVVHTGAHDLAVYTRQADILVAAMGQPEIITGDMIKAGAVVIDVGMNRVPSTSAKNGYKLVGDVEFGSCSLKASAITPVPGGVGPMTIAMLMKNTLTAASGTIE